MQETQKELEQRLADYRQIIELADKGYLQDPQSMKLASRYRELIPKLEGLIDDYRCLRISTLRD